MAANCMVGAGWGLCMASSLGREPIALKLQATNKWPSLLHVTGLPKPPWSHGSTSHGDHPGHATQEVLELENVGDPRDGGVVDGANSQSIH